MKYKLKNPVIYVVGPTASGKTYLSIELAKHFGGQIICCDSMQIYKGMSIATAAPTLEEKGEIQHRLFEFLEPSEPFSVSDYCELAKAEIESVRSENSLPIVVGGTGLYIDSLAENIDFGADSNDDRIRRKLEDKAKNEGLDALYSELQTVDPEAAERISKNDAKRIIRALEVFLVSGETITEKAKKSKAKGKIYDNIFIGVNFKDREKLYDRINKRVDVMFENGLLEESKRFLDSKGKTSAQAIGHKELKPYLLGQCTEKEALEHLKMQTRRYAKRQLTWFQRNNDINWIYMDESTDPILDAISIIEKKLY